MRKFKLQTQTSVDGYMAGPNGEMDWVTSPWTDDIKAYVTALTEPVDCIVLGRKLAEGFIPAWASQPRGLPAASPRRCATVRLRDHRVALRAEALLNTRWTAPVQRRGRLAATVPAELVSENENPDRPKGGRRGIRS